jgi:hypothetical protein
VLAHDPFSPQATAVLNQLDDALARLSRDTTSPWHGATFDFAGTTAGKRDLQAVIEGDQTRIMQLVTVAVLVVIVTRVFEEQQRRTRIEGLRRAVAQTGGIITSCGIIMAGSFLSMLSGSLRGMLELGFALTLGIVLDTFLVRPILVPAFLAMLYRWQDRRDQRDTPRLPPAKTPRRRKDAEERVPQVAGR